MKKLILICSLIPALAISQSNLSSRGSFEQVEKKCFKGEKSALREAGISSSNNTSIDFYSADKNDRSGRIENNHFGSQQPFEGKNYAGFTAFYADETGVIKTKPGYQKYTEYIQIALDRPLAEGETYNVSFKISLAENSAYAVSGIGVYFTNYHMDVKNNSFLDVEPHLVSPEIISSDEWTKITGVYVAKGGENHITLGAFSDFMIAEKIISDDVNNSRKAYYFVDDITVSSTTKIKDTPLAVILYGECYQLETVNFNHNEAILLPGSYEELDELAAFFKKYPYLKVFINGYTDKTGTDDYNDQLSVDRAKAVKSYLADAGINEDRLIIKGYGSEYPVDTKNKKSKANRRVEIISCNEDEVVIK